MARLVPGLPVLLDVRRQLGEGKHPGRVDDDGKPKAYKGITRDEAVRLEREILATRDRGERQPDVRTAPLFGIFATAWVEENRSGWKASTLQQYEQVLKSQLRPAYEDVRLSHITESRIKQLVTELQDGGCQRAGLTWSCSF